MARINRIETAQTSSNSVARRSGGDGSIEKLGSISVAA